MRTLTLRKFLAGALTLAILGFVTPPFALAQSADEVELVAPVTGVVVAATDSNLELDVFVKNKTPVSRPVAFEIEGAPSEWDVAVWHRFESFKVTRSVIQPTPADGPGERFRLRMTFPEDLEPGMSTFTVRVLPVGGGAAYDDTQFTVTVTAAAEPEEPEVTVRSDFPSLSGAATNLFEFEIVIMNQTGGERSFDLSAEVPQGWDVTFLPAFGQERDKVITAVSVPDGLDERVKVRVEPLFFAAAGEHAIPVRVSADPYEAQAALRLTIVGRGSLQVMTPEGVRNEFDAKAGDPAGTTVRLINRGGAEMRNIALAAEVPANDWAVRFQVDTIESLPVDNQIDIGVTVTPPPNAPPGDYIVTVRATHPDARGVIPLRVTVEESSIWGWLGTALGVLVIGGFVGLVLRYGRR